ncbi:TSUP family transporter, partial [Staphylococcus aureus]
SSDLLLLFFKVTPKPQKSNFNPILLIGIGLVIGTLSGIVGAGGAFIITPILLAVFKLPMNTVVANSIVIAFISSIGAFAMKAFQGHIPLDLAIAIILGSIIF